MKKQMLFFGTLLSVLSTGAQWDDNGTNLTTTDTVGIGTTAPSDKLQVLGNISTNEGNITLYNDSINQEDSGTIRWNEYTPNNQSKAGAYIRYNGSGNYLQVLTNNEILDYEHIRMYRLGNLLLQPTSGNVGIGTTIPDAKLAVNGTIHAKEVKIDLIGWPDYVFKKDYRLPTLKEVEIYIKEKGHLKDIPSAKAVEGNGLFLGEINKKLLLKIEELTLYTIQQQKEIDELKQENENLKSISHRVEKLEKLLLFNEE